MDSELSRVVDVLPGLVWTALADGHVDFVNQSWCEYTGRGLDEARGDAWQRLVHPDDLDDLLERWALILASGLPRDMQARLRRFDGEYRRFVLRVRPLTGASGEIIKWCGMNTDIEDCHRIGSRTRHDRSDLVDFIDDIPALVSLMTPEGALDCVNRQTNEYLGATLEELKRWPASEIVHPDDLPTVVATWMRSIGTGEPYDIEHRIRRADGTYRWFHVRGLPLREGEGRIARWCVLELDIDDRKRSEALLASTMAELVASEDRLRATIDTVPGCVWRAAPDGGVEFLNQRWCDYTGLSMAESLGIGWTSRIHPADSPALGSYWQALLEAGRPGSFEARLRRFDGTYRWFLIRAVPLLDDAGHVVKWYGQNTDIEDRKRAELLLEGEKQLLGLVATGMPLVVVLSALCELVQASVDGALCSIVLVAPRCAGSSKKDSPGLRLQPGAAPNVPDELLKDLVAGSLEPDANPVALAATRGEMVFATDLAVDTRWSAWRSVVSSHGIRACWTMPLNCSRGDVVGVLSMLFREAKAPELPHHNLLAQFTHIASIAIERARNEAALKQSEAFLAKAQRVSSTGALSWCVVTDELTWSDEVYRIYELDPALPATFERIYSRMHPEDIPSYREMSRQRRLLGKDFEHEHRLVMPDQSVKYLRLFAHAIRDEEGNLEYIGAVQDVTHRRLSDEALDKVRSELAHVARVATLGTLTASIAHEVNQPLSGIITNANTCLRMLGADPPNIEGARETARRTIRDGDRASEVIKRLHALFAKKSVTTESVNLNEAAREVIAMLLGELQRNGVIVHPDFADDEPTICGDRVQLQQVILNLIMNASDAMNKVMDRPRHMRVSTHRKGDGQVCLTVSDCGTGFERHDAERMFHAFYTTKTSGMGIGLSVSRSIIEGHRGRLWAESNDGPGATFAFALPQSAGSAGAEADATTGKRTDVGPGAWHTMEGI